MLQTASRLIQEPPGLAPISGFWTWDVQADRIFGAASMADYFGTSVSDVVAGLPVDSFMACIHADDRLDISATLRRTLKTGSPYQVRYRVHSPKFGLRQMVAQGQCHFDGAGKPIVLCGWFIDVTDRAAATPTSMLLCQHFLEQARLAADAGDHHLASYLLEVVRQEIEKSGQSVNGDDH